MWIFWTKSTLGMEWMAFWAKHFGTMNRQGWSMGQVSQFKIIKNNFFRCWIVQTEPFQWRKSSNIHWPALSVWVNLLFIFYFSSTSSFELAKWGTAITSDIPVFRYSQPNSFLAVDVQRSQGFCNQRTAIYFDNHTQQGIIDYCKNKNQYFQLAVHLPASWTCPAVFKAIHAFSGHRRIFGVLRRVFGSKECGHLRAMTSPILTLNQPRVLWSASSRNRSWIWEWSVAIYSKFFFPLIQ